MEGKKKKIKKKKGNQAKQNDSTSTTEDVNQTKQNDSVSNAVDIQDHNHAAVSEMNKRTEAPSTSIGQSVGVSESDAEKERRKKLDANCDGLEEKVEDLDQSFALEKNSIKKMVSNLGDANEGLQMQVMELKESMDRLEKENKHMTERISTLESRIQHLETVSSSDDSSKVHGEEEKHQREAEVSVEPDVLNEESTAKVYETHVKLDYSEDAVKTVANDFLELRERILECNGKSQTMGYALESFSMNGGVDFGSAAQSRQIRLLGSIDDSGISEDVVSVPLDDSDHGLKSMDEMDSGQTVPISDAPLIGAPFRLISLVTRYVSGADLVDQPKARR